MDNTFVKEKLTAKFGDALTNWEEPYGMLTFTALAELNLKVMIGCMNESSVGTAAIAQLAPLLDYVDMDGPLLLNEDIADGVTFNQGKICYNDFVGLGIKLKQY